MRLAEYVSVMNFSKEKEPSLRPILDFNKMLGGHGDFGSLGRLVIPAGEQQAFGPPTFLRFPRQLGDRPWMFDKGGPDDDIVSGSLAAILYGKIHGRDR